MKLAYYVNYINHHRVMLADELYKLLGKDFVLVTTMPRNPDELKGGSDYSTRPYCLLAAENAENRELALKYARESEVCSFGANAVDFAIERAKYGRKDGIAFETSERWLKKGWYNIFSPRLLKMWMMYLIYFRKGSFYKLCSSAYAANDHYKLGMYRNRCFKWGYFTEVPDLMAGDACQHPKSDSTVRIMWCARFIDWKHPEVPLRLASNLKSHGYNFVINMYGDGIMRANMESQCKQLGLSDCVKFFGNVSNAEIHNAMQLSDIFLFTSDRNEGWGAVANEAMSNKCVVVGNRQIGSIPFLINDGVNGFIYDSEKQNSLVEIVENLIDNRQLIKSVGQKAREDIENIWSPKVAASNLVTLCNNLISGGTSSIPFGPCSLAVPLKNEQNK